MLPSVIKPLNQLLFYRNPFTQLYSMTYMYYSFVGCFITVLVGWTISYFTESSKDIYDETLVHPIARKMARVFPGKKRRYLEKTRSPDMPRSSSMKPSASNHNFEKKNGLNGNCNTNHEVPMETLEVYKTKL